MEGQQYIFRSSVVLCLFDRPLTPVSQEATYLYHGRPQDFSRGDRLGRKELGDGNSSTGSMGGAQWRSGAKLPEADDTF